MAPDDSVPMTQHWEGHSPKINTGMVGKSGMLINCRDIVMRPHSVDIFVSCPWQMLIMQQAVLRLDGYRISSTPNLTSVHLPTYNGIRMLDAVARPRRTLWPPWATRAPQKAATRVSCLAFARHATSTFSSERLMTPTTSSAYANRIPFIFHRRKLITTSTTWLAAWNQPTATTRPTNTTL